MPSHERAENLAFPKGDKREEPMLDLSICPECGYLIAVKEGVYSPFCSLECKEDYEAEKNDAYYFSSIMKMIEEGS